MSYLLGAILFFENVNLPFFRTISDLLLLITISILILKKMILNKKIKVNKKNIIVFTLLFIPFAFNTATGFQNVDLSINSLLDNKLEWLINDRKIDNFIPFGDYYRSISMYLRYMLIPVYFSLGYNISKDNYGIKLNIIYHALLISLLINMSAGFINNDQRLSGFFDNTANLTSLSLLVLSISLFLHNKNIIIFSFILCIITLYFSQTISGYIGLISLLLIFILKIKSSHKKVIYILLIITIVISILGLMPFIDNFLSSYFYMGSLYNRLIVWSSIIGYFNEPLSLTFGLGTFPLFSDNVFIWFYCGFGIFSLSIIYYLLAIGNINNSTSLTIGMMISQSILFPGFFMPYMLITTFITLGVLSSKKNT